MTAPAQTELGMVIDDLLAVVTARRNQDSLALRELVVAMEAKSFSVLILVFGLLLVSPLSAVPGATTLFGLAIAAIVAQHLVGSTHVWLPAFLLNRSLPAAKTERALRWLERPVDWLESRARSRLVWAVTAPFAAAPMLLVLLASICAPLMEVIPGSGSSVGAAISLFSLGLLARDGLFVVTGAALAAILPFSLWLLLT